VRLPPDALHAPIYCPVHYWGGARRPSILGTGWWRDPPDARRWYMMGKSNIASAGRPVLHDRPPYLMIGLRSVERAFQKEWV
jgi:hypothetical protein